MNIGPPFAAVAFSFVLDSSFKSRAGATFISGHQRMAKFESSDGRKTCFCFDG
jgi:hypothetical protein